MMLVAALKYIDRSKISVSSKSATNSNRAVDQAIALSVHIATVAGKNSMAVAK